MRQFDFMWRLRIFDVVSLLHDVKIVARFYKVQYEHVKRDVVARAFVFVPNFLQYVSAENWQNLDDT